MKTNRFFKYCCIALVAVGFGLNIQNAIENYGIGENSLSLVATNGTGMFDSSSCFDGSIAFESCTYTNATVITQIIRRCGPFAGKWILKGKKWADALGVIVTIWEIWEQKSYQVAIPEQLSEEIEDLNGSIKTRKYTRFTCTEIEGSGESNCDPVGGYFELEGWI